MLIATYKPRIRRIGQNPDNFNVSGNGGRFQRRLRARRSRMKAQILAVVALTVLASVGVSRIAMADNAQAGLYVEPGITYESGTTSTSYPTGDSGGTNRGLGIMGRVGFQLNDIFFIAADARFSKPHFTDGNIDADANAYQVGPVAGIQTPVAGLRVWAEYVAQAQLDPSGTSNFDAKFKNGTGFTIGAGFHILAASLNLEYQKLSYATTEFQSVGPFTNVGDSDRTKMKNEAYIVSVTFPIGI